MALTFGEVRGLMAAEREQDLLDRRQSVFDRAHARRAEQHRQQVLANPTEFSGAERKAVFADEQRRQLNANELEMLKTQEGFNLEKERVKAEGLRDQGIGAMRLRTDTDRYIADQTRIAKGEETRMLGESSRAQHGYFDENGEYHAGSTVKAAEAAGLSRAELELAKQEARLGEIEKRNQFIAEQNQLERELKGQQFEKKEQRLTTQQQQKELNNETKELQKIYTAAAKGDYIKAGMTPSQWKKMSDSEKEAFARKQLVPPKQPNNGATNWKTRYSK